MRRGPSTEQPHTASLLSSCLLFIAFLFPSFPSGSHCSQTSLLSIDGTSSGRSKCRLWGQGPGLKSQGCYLLAM